MLLTKTVMLKWTSNIKKYYQEKGYIFTKYGDEIEVKIEDLSKGSKVVVDVRCCCCEEVHQISYNNYNKRHAERNYYLCHKCALRNNENKSTKTKLSKSKSFEDWCVENNRQDVLDRWDYGLNNCLPSEVSYSSNSKRWFKCPRGIHDSVHKSIVNFTERNTDIVCDKCSSFSQYLIDLYGENALEIYWDYNKNTLNPWKISCGSIKKVWLICQEKDYHDSYNIGIYQFTRGIRCPYCVNRKVHTKDSLGQYIIDNYGQDFLDKVWSDKNKKPAFEYSPHNKEKVWWNCLDNKHEDYFREINSSNSLEFKCPECSQERRESFLQEKVRLYLECLNNGNSTILHENYCTIVPKNPKTKCSLLFDNEIKELKLIIEVNGEQHYKISGFHKTQAKRNNTIPEYEFHYQKLKDRYKRISAIQQGYFYLEIPYWADNEDETWKKLIDNKLKEILKDECIKEVL